MHIEYFFRGKRVSDGEAGQPENYGLQVRRNGIACCPFHDDKHPSMKIDINYHCFACGAGGDVIDYVSRMFGLSQYGAARKLIDDFCLPIELSMGSR